LRDHGSGKPSTRPGLLQRLGLHRPELRAWALYDWANSAVITTVNTAVFPIFFATYAMAGQPDELAVPRLGVAVTMGLVISAVLSPILGAIADVRGSKKRMLGGFMGVGVSAIACMYFIQQGQWLLAVALYVLANIGVRTSFVFYDALLPHVAREEEVDRVSTAGYAVGYLGGGLLLALNLAWIVRPDLFGLPSGPDLAPAQASLPARLAILSVAAWWLVFAIPLFRKVAEPAPALEPGENGRSRTVRVGLRRLARTVRELRSYRQAFLVLLAVLLYGDGIGTIQNMAVIYGAQLGLDRTMLMGAILMVQFIGVPFAFLFGSLAGAIGTRRSIFLGLAVYVGISVLGYFMTTATHFLLLAGLVGMVQGGTQALSRSLFSSVIPAHRSGEFFGFFGIIERFAGSIGPLMMGVATVVTGTPRTGILSVILLFLAGGAVLTFVDVQEGQATARAAERVARTGRGASGGRAGGAVRQREES
jgi:MFS transporter, UMF1 family